jgi:restriction system protein
MAEITRKRTGELLQELFTILLGSSIGLPARDALHQLAAKVTLTPYEAGDFESGGPVF